MQRRRATGVGPKTLSPIYVTFTFTYPRDVLAPAFGHLFSNRNTSVRGFAPTGVLCAHGAERQRAT
jgi:hypothetical protein